MNRTRPPWTRLLVAIAIPVLAFVALAAWAFSSPVGSSPDDDFHLASAWCGLGERPGICENPGDPVDRLVPAPLPEAFCYAFDPAQSGACWDPDGEGLTLVERANADGLYPRVFYATMSVFASPDLQASVIAMRLFNAAFAVGLLTAVFWALPRWMRPALVVSVAASSVPLGLFVLASNNPSAWAVLSAATVWITVLATLQATGRRRVLLAALSLVCVVVGAGARADAAVYAVFGVILALILGVRRPRSIRALAFPLALAAVLAAVSLAFYLSAWQGGSVVTGMTDGRSPLSPGQVVNNFLNVPSLWTGALGGWSLGWIDTALPAVVSVLSTSVFGGALFVGLRHAGWRRGFAVLSALAAMWVVPFVLLYQSKAIVGELVQPRYILPLMVIALGVASLRIDADQAWRGTRLVLGTLTLTAAAAVALHVNINRYITGRDEFHPNLDHTVEWWWVGAPSPTTTWILGTLAFAGVFALFGVILHRRPPVAAVPEGAAVRAVHDDQHPDDDRAASGREAVVVAPAASGS